MQQITYFLRRMWVRILKWWYPTFISTITDQDELGYGTVTITPAKRTIPGRIRGWKYRSVRPTRQPSTSAQRMSTETSWNWTSGRSASEADARNRAGGIVLASVTLAVLYGLLFLVMVAVEKVADEIGWAKRRREYRKDNEAKQKARSRCLTLHILQ